YRNASMYLRYLRIIDRESDKLEMRLQHSTANREILMLMELSKSLVYFTTSLKSNEVVLEKLTSLQRFRYYEDDADLLEDVITENKQAIEMASIYQSVLQGMTDAFGTIVSNNVNNVMKIYTIISLVMSIPTMIFSMYGMNFTNIPLSGHPFGFWIMTVLSMALAGIAGWVFTRSNRFK
nr:magnesium transporter CorA family protein [Alloscardovia omnicolens]